VTSGAPWRTPAVIPTTMKSTRWCPSTRSSSYVSVARDITHEARDRPPLSVEGFQALQRRHREHPVDLRDVHAALVVGSLRRRAILFFVLLAVLFSDPLPRGGGPGGSGALPVPPAGPAPARHDLAGFANGDAISVPLDVAVDRHARNLALPPG